MLLRSYFFFPFYSLDVSLLVTGMLPHLLVTSIYLIIFHASVY